MTSSPIRPTFSRNAPRPAHRTKLLAASALVSSLMGGVAAMLAQPAVSGTLPGIPSAANITVSTGGSQPVISFPDAITLQIELNAPRTVINWTDLHLSSGDAMNFLFDSASDIVLNKTTSQIRFDNGSVVTGKVGAATAGNVWFYSPQGVIISPGATMTAGGFLFSKGSGLVDASFVDSAAPLTFLRSTADALIQMTTISSATSASINSSGDVVLSASSGALNVSTAVGATVDISTTSGSITASEVVATSGAASVAAGGPGATVTQITGDTGVTVSSSANTSVGAATTTTSGDILLTSNGSASLTLGNSARDVTISAPQVFVSTIDAARDVFVTGSTAAYVTNRIFAGDDIEITASAGDVSAGGAYLKSTGLGASDDAHILLRSDTGSVNAGNTLLTQGTGAQAGDITIQAATTASLGTASSTRDIKVSGTSASLSNGSAARDVFVTATTGNATVVTAATAGDDVEVTTTSGDVLASGATLKSTGAGATDDAHVLARSSDGAVNVGAAITQGAGATAGDVTLDAGGTITAGSLTATRDAKAVAAGDIDLTSATSDRDITITSNGGQAILRAATLTGSGSGHDLSITAVGNAVLGDPDYTAITTANLFSRTGGNTGTASVKSTGGVAMVHLDTSALIDTLEGADVDVTVASGLASFGTITALTGNLYAETYDGGLTVGSATANSGTLDLYVAGGDLTITGSVHGDGATHLETDGLLDGTAATLISSGDDLTLIGGSVDVGEVTAALALDATAATGNILVQKAVAGETVVVAAINGDATLRGAEGPDGVTVLAMNKATFGADDKASITTANYAITNPSCGCGTDGLQILSYDGDVVVNIDSASNGITLVGAAIDGSATVVQKTGDLVIGELAAYDITIEAMAGTLDVSAISSGGDYTVTAQDFVGDSLTPYLFNGDIRDVTITDTLGDLDLGSLSLYAGRKLTVTSQAGAVLGSAQLLAGTGVGDGEVRVTGHGVSLDTAEADYDVDLNAGTGAVTVGTSVTAGYNYHLTGASFSANALSPTGTQAGSWFIKVLSGYDFDFTGHDLHYVGGIGVEMVNGDVTGGDVTSDTGDVYLEANNVQVETLSAANGQVTAHGYFGDALIGSATAGDQIIVTANLGDAKLGSAMLTGTGTNSLLVTATNGDVVLGAATPGVITAANIVTSAGSSTIVEASTTTGSVDVNLDHTTTADLTTIDALNAVNITVLNGSQRIIAARSITGAVNIDGPSGALTIDGLTANADSQVNGGGDTRLVSALVDGDLTVTSATGALRFGDAVPGRVIEVSGALTLDAATDVAQQGVLKANSLGVTSGTGVVLLGANEVSYLDTVSVTAGGFAFNDTQGFDLYGPITATGQTVDLRSAHAIGQVSTGIITAQTLTGSSVGGANFGAANQVTQLGDFTNTGGLLKLVDGRSLTITGTVLSTGTLALTSHAGMTFASTGKVTADGAGDAIVLASDGTFTNARGADAVTASNAAGRWLIYTQAVGNASGSTAANSFSGLAGKSFYGSAYDFSNEVLAVTPNAGNRFVYAYQPTLTVTPDSRIVTYDGSVPTTSATITGLVNGDLAADAWSGAATVSGATSRNVGTYVLSAGAGTLASDLNYAFAYGTGSLRIDPKVLTGVLTANDKTYDRSTSATGVVTLSGVISGDTVGAAGTYAFDDWNAGTGKTVTASGVTLSGGDAGNYSLGAVSSDTADIFQKAITGALAANDKTYDRSTAATGVVTLAGVISGDTVGAAGTYAFGDWNAASGKTVTASGVTLSGGDAGNYSLGVVSSDTADIFKKAITGALTANDKTYDRSTAATGVVTLAGVISGDTVGAGGTYAFGDWNAGTGKTVTASGVTLSGGDAGNYSLGAVSSDTADIFKKAITGALTANDKIYDRSTAATGVVTLSGVISGDTVGAAGTYAFGDWNAGTGKIVTASGVTLSGGDAGNYSLGTVSSDTADIFKKTITGALTASNKTYDGATTASGTIGLTGVVTGDTVSAAGVYAFADRNAGAGKTVTVSGATLAGLDAANYSLSGVSAGLADILRRSVTVSADDTFKIQGHFDPTLTYRITVGDLVAGDAFTGGLARDAGETAGAYAITRGTLGLSANYDLTFTGAVFTIDPLPPAEQNASTTLKHLNASPDFTLDWDPELKLETQGAGCPGEGCPPLPSTVALLH